MTLSLARCCCDIGCPCSDTMLTSATAHWSGIFTVGAPACASPCLMLGPGPIPFRPYVDTRPFQWEGPIVVHTSSFIAPCSMGGNRTQYYTYGVVTGFNYVNGPVCTFSGMIYPSEAHYTPSCIVYKPQDGHPYWRAKVSSGVAFQTATGIEEYYEWWRAPYNADNPCTPVLPWTLESTYPSMTIGGCAYPQFAQFDITYGVLLDFTPGVFTLT